MQRLHKCFRLNTKPRYIEFQRPAEISQFGNLYHDEQHGQFDWLILALIGADEFKIDSPKTFKFIFIK